VTYLDSCGFLSIGHRGAAGHEPENTLRSIRRALELGAHGVEIDARLIDGELIVFHDDRLDRTTNGHGAISRQCFAHLRTFDAGKGERIPTLREVFETVDRRAFINVELKGRRCAAPVQALIREFVDERGWSAGHFLVSSFLRRELRAITDPRIRIGLLLTKPTPLYHVSARRVRAWSVHPAVRFTTVQFVADAHRRGLKVIPYTANTFDELARIRATGADGVFTDFPERVAATPPPALD
jgi:glycerophosphoryl diester phosphodiesterase